jgi:uncharacterized membrane protein YbhN (UPF0104 family)
LRRFVTWLFLALVVLFLVLYLRTIDWDSVRAIRPNWWFVGIATVVSLLFRYLGVYVWRGILRDLGTTELPAFSVMADVYATSWMGRYIPGTVTWIAGKVYMASAWGVSKSRLAVASLLEGGVQVAALTFVSFLLLGFDKRFDVLSGGAKGLLLLLGVAVLVVLIPAVFNRLFKLAFRILRRGTPHSDLHINERAVSRAFILYAIGGFLSGGSCFLIAKAAMPDLGWNTYLYVVGSFSLATVAGMAAPFAPSGLGIRDGIQLVLLTAIMPKEIALVATVFIRLWTVVADVIFFAIARSLRGRTVERATEPH